MSDPLDTGCSVVLALSVATVLGSHAVASAAGRLFVAQRVEREDGLPLVGKTPMHAVYRVLLPVGRALAAHGVSAHAVTGLSLALAAVAAVAFAGGHFGLGAAIGCVAALADAIDGIVARESGTQSRLGQVFDTTVDRYVDALLLGGIAVHVRHDALLLCVVLGAIVGAFMVSYASSLERELGYTSAGGSVPMRRAHRLAYLLLGAAVSPLVVAMDGSGSDRLALVPVFLAVVAIAAIGNVSAVRRIYRAAHHAPLPVPPAPDSTPADSGKPVLHGTEPLSGGAHR